MLLRNTALIAIGTSISLSVGACGPRSEQSGAVPSGSSESAVVREPAASSSNPEAPTILSGCSRPQVREVSPTVSGLPRTLGYEVMALGLQDGSGGQFWDPYTSQVFVGMAINDAGQVVGNARIGGAEGFNRAYLWTPGGRVDYIEGVEGQGTWAQDVNSSGQVAGNVAPTSDGSNLFVWDAGTRLRTLEVHAGPGEESVYHARLNDRGQVSGTLDTHGAANQLTGTVAFRMEPDGTVSKAPVEQTDASDMNAVGEVVLTVEDETTGDQQLYVWQSGATLIDGGPITGDSQPRINDAGLVVATAWDAAEGECGFVWDTRTGNRSPIGRGVNPIAVNGNGQVTGVWDAGDGRHAFLWDSASGLLDLGTVPGFDDSYGVAINDHGQLVGLASGGGRDGDRVTSFLWDPSAGLIELHPLHAGDSTFVAGINNSGTVVGVSGPLVPQEEEASRMEGVPVIWSPIG